MRWNHILTFSNTLYRKIWSNLNLNLNSSSFIYFYLFSYKERNKTQKLLNILHIHFQKLYEFVCHHNPHNLFSLNPTKFGHIVSAFVFFTANMIKLQALGFLQILAVFIRVLSRWRSSPFFLLMRLTVVRESVLMIVSSHALLLTNFIALHMSHRSAWRVANPATIFLTIYYDHL